MEYTSISPKQLKWDLMRPTSSDRYEAYWRERNAHFIPESFFANRGRVWLEIGAGTGAFFVDLARRHSDVLFIAVERCRMRGKRLVRRASRAQLDNLAAFRGNAIPALIHGIPSESVERIYILYPCPWPKTAQRRQRWYLHPIMPHLVRILKPYGVVVWASDQRFYIEEAHWVSTQHYGMRPLVFGPVCANPWNDLEHAPEGRTKFERTFLAAGQPCYELVVQKPLSDAVGRDRAGLLC